ncbi:MAG: calcium-binding protein [Comamonadaceae bacterium]|nr:calcium-binding protein [Comamonadaceae bacterium]
MSSISGVNGLSNAWANANTQRSQMQAKMFGRVDTDSSGGVDQTELQNLFTEISKKTGITLDAEKLFSAMDGNADGSLASDELASGLKDVMPPPPTTMEFAQGRSGMGGNNDLFAKVDANSDGSVDETEMTAFTDKIKTETGRDSPTTFTQLDTDSDGKLTQSEFDAGKPTGGPQGSANGPQGAQGPGGPPPPGGPGGARGTSESSTADSTSYDPLDTNQDGTVSELERLAGALKEFVNASESSSGSESSASDAVLKLAKLVYEQIASGGLSLSSTSTLDATA